MNFDRDAEEQVFIACNAMEASKLQWLVRVIEGLHVAHAMFKEDAEVTRWDEGVAIDRQIDWRAIQSFCFPHLVVVMAKNEKGRDDFHEFPLYVVLPRLGQAHRLSDRLYPEVTSDEQTVGVEQLLQSLESVVLTVKGPKGENAMRQLKILQRLLRSTF